MLTVPLLAVDKEMAKRSLLLHAKLLDFLDHDQSYLIHGSIDSGLSSQFVDTEPNSKIQ